jgi:molecular chaperone Hsp33
MSEQHTHSLTSMALAGDDKVVPFQVDALDVRGRAVQLGPLLNEILDRHAYPAPVAALLGEAIVLTVLLGTSLKFNGKFIFQIQGDGPVSLLVVDYRTPDSVRAYARYDDGLVQSATERAEATPEKLLGEGILAMTVDQGPDMQRFQGIVQLDGRSLEDAAWQYFRQSEQIPTMVRLAAAEILAPAAPGGKFTHRWRAGGMVVQFLPESPERMRLDDLPGGDAPEGFEEAARPADDAWAETTALVETIADDELTDPQIGSERLLYRLFHEHGVRVFEGQGVVHKCSCSRQRIIEIIANLDEKEREEAMRDGTITTTCEFCSKTYELTRDEVQRNTV